MTAVPRIDMKRTGANIAAMRKSRNISISRLQKELGFNTPQAIYKWQRGETVPTLDNLVILAELFGVTISEIVAVTR